jgi:glycosyltransferase involved in cell wall biosynthesis
MTLNSFFELLSVFLERNETDGGTTTLKKVKLIHEVHDVWPETLIELGGFSKIHPFIKVLQCAEDSSCKNSDAIVSLAPFAKAHMIKHGMEENKFNHLPNGVALNEWQSSSQLPNEHSNVLDNISSNGNFIVGYFGGHALSNALNILLDVARETKGEQISYVLVGNGVEKSNLIEQSKIWHLTNVYFLPTISKQTIPSLLARFDCIYMGSYKSDLYKYGTCLNKMFDSMMAAKPIVCAITTPSTPVSESGCGFSVDSEDVNAIIDSIHSIIALSLTERKLMGELGKSAVLEKYNYKNLANEFISVIEGA